MSRKTHKLTIAALSAATVFALGSAENSGAFAQEEDSSVQADTVREVADAAPQPVFVSNEIVQSTAEPANDGSSEEEIPAQTAPQNSAQSLRELVGTTATDFALSEQMRCLAGAVYFEARGEPLAGQLAVAKVVMNRSDDSRFPSGYCGVVYQRAQFSFVKNGRMPSIRTSTAAWKRARAIALIAHEGQWDSEADDSLYFHAKYVRPSWSRKKSQRATISSHIFYR